MDPTVNLAMQVALAETIRNHAAPDTDAARLAEHVLALHEWIEAGGFLPGYVAVSAVCDALQAGHENDSAADQVEYVSDLVGFEASGVRA